MSEARGASSDNVEGTSAELRVARTITVINGVGALFLGAISLGSILAATAYLTPPFTLVAVSVIFGGYGVLTFITFVSGMRVIRMAHGIYAIVFVLVNLLVDLAYRAIDPRIAPPTTAIRGAR